MQFEEPPRGALAGSPQQVEELKVGADLARRTQARSQAAEMDAVDVETTVASAGGALRQMAVVDQAVDELHAAHFGDQRRVEGDFVEAVDDLAGRARRG